jgi:hypothetical protein
MADQFLEGRAVTALSLAYEKRVVNPVLDSHAVPG